MKYTRIAAGLAGVGLALAMTACGSSQKTADKEAGSGSNAGAPDAAPDHDALGVHQIAKIRHRHPHVAPGVGQRAPADRVARLRPDEDVLGLELLAGAALDQGDERRRAGDGLEAAAIAAAADVARLVEHRRRAAR